MGERLSVYRSLMAASVRNQLAYPTSFTLQCAAQAVVQLEDMVVIVVLFTRVSEMGGFTRQEVLLIFSPCGDLLRAGRPAGRLIGQGRSAGPHRDAGRPAAAPAARLDPDLRSDFALRRLGKIGTAFAVLGYVLCTSDISWTPLRVTVLLMTPLTGLVLLGAVWVVASTTIFWLVEGQELPNAVTYGSGMFTSFPVSIFSG